MQSSIEFRHYQSSAIDSTLQWFADGKEKPLIVLPTGTGKSLVQAGLINKIIEQFPYVRIICATHSKELVEQNYEEMISLCPNLFCGIYSAGLNRREAKSQILFAGIQSVYNKVGELGYADIIFVDEAHTISKKSETRWGKFFADMKVINPNVQIIGLTATPYRLDSGNLIPHTFDGVAYEYPIIDAIKEGYLCELISAPVRTHLTTVGVHKRGGEFIAGELERAVDKDHLNKACVAEIMSFGQDRKSWIVFCAGKSHAEHITQLLVENGIDAKCVTDDTPRDERDRIVADHKAGKLKCLVNNTIFTTGYNNRMLDMIACLRPTESEGLWVQICGRGMRLYPNKENCLLLDFGRNIDRHGPIDKIKGKNKNESSGNGEAPLKQCPSCFEPVHAAVKICPNCGFEFPENQMNLTMIASSGAILSTQLTPQEYTVINTKYKKTIGKNGKPDSLQVIYTTLSGQIREWVFFDHPSNSIPRLNANKWAKEMGATAVNVEHALTVEWKKPSSIVALKDGKFWKIKKYIFN